MDKNGDLLDRVKSGMEKFIQSPSFMNLVVGVRSLPLFVVSAKVYEKQWFVRSFIRGYLLCSYQKGD